MAVSVDYASTSLRDEGLEQEFEAELSAIRSSAPSTEPHLIGGRELYEGELIERMDPCVPSAVVGAAHIAGESTVSDAIRAAREVAPGWRRTPYSKRIEHLLAARDVVASQLVALAAIASAETGKTRLESIGEANEAVDMITHYCDLMARNDGYEASLESTPLERNYDVLVPYGTFAVISPFNFPIALSVGMMAAALVTGNTVVLKPSDKTPRSTGAIARILHDQLPAGVLNVVHGNASTGKHLASGAVDGVAFTGSAAVGWELVAQRGPDGRPRPVLAEMGGQNPAIVTRTADISAAAEGITRSAFGLSGQKCSACRRVIVDAEVADRLVEELVTRAEALTVGDPLDAATHMGPVIDDSIATRIDEALAAAERDGRIRTGGRADVAGNFFRPTIITDLRLGHALTRDELFAPVLTVTSVDGFDAAIAEANAVDYGLTAGIFTEEAAEVDRFLNEIEAGVVYVNRAAGATTGAWPGVQSFCGWKLSGSTGKGGLGLWYLPGFMREQSRTIASKG